MPPLAASLLAIAAGAALGAIARWGLALALNGLFAPLPPGTLAANVVGGFLIGLALPWLAAHPELPAAWRLFIVTGFLGGLTTFSTFSAEVVAQLHAGRAGWAAALAAAHLVASVAATLAGFAVATAALRGP